MNKQPVVLEKSTNTHLTNSDVEVVKEFHTMTTVVLKQKAEGMIVEHGHHNTVATEPTDQQVIKITQQEFNPILAQFQNSFD